MPKHHYLKSKVADLENNPHTQIKFHFFMMRLWAWSSAIVFIIYLFSFVAPLRVAITIIAFINFVTNQISFYANWDTDFGAVSAAQANIAAGHIPPPQTAKV